MLLAGFVFRLTPSRGVAGCNKVDDLEAEVMMAWVNASRGLRFRMNGSVWWNVYDDRGVFIKIGGSVLRNSAVIRVDECSRPKSRREQYLLSTYYQLISRITEQSAAASFTIFSRHDQRPSSPHTTALQIIQ